MSDDKPKIKDMLFARLRENSDFPAMSITINMVNEFEASEDSSISEFANIILRDYALTSKILKILNSVHYAHFGDVTTISRAIIILGFKNIKNLAVALMIFGHFQKHGSNLELIDSIARAFYSAILAQKISSDLDFIDNEEAFICALFHSLGKMVVAFSFPEKAEEIKNLSKDAKMPEDLAATSVLGTSYEQIGTIAAKEWNFPNKIIYSMQRMRNPETMENANELDRLRSISTFTNEISSILVSSSSQEETDEQVQRLVALYNGHFGSLEDKIKVIIDSSKQAMLEYANIFSLKLELLPFSRQLFGWTFIEEKQQGQPDILSESLKTIDTIVDDDVAETPESIFAKGIQDINNSILGNFSLNDIVRIVLETMYRGMQLSGLSKVLFCIKDTRQPLLTLRLGFGSDVNELKEWFKIPLGAHDLFNMSVTNPSDFVIKDISSPDIKAILPDWYRDRISPDIFVILLPIVINKKVIGLFYVEGPKEQFKTVTRSHLNYLKILRDQTVMAIKQRPAY